MSTSTWAGWTGPPSACASCPRPTSGGERSTRRRERRPWSAPPTLGVRRRWPRRRRRPGSTATPAECCSAPAGCRTATRPHCANRSRSSGRSSAPTRRHEPVGSWGAPIAPMRSAPLPPWAQRCPPSRRSAVRPLSGSGAVLRLAQSRGEGLEQRPGALRVFLDEGPDLPGGHPAAAQVGRGRNGRRPGALVDQRDLAEMVAGADRSHDLPADGHGGLAVLDQEEADPAAALRGDRLALGEAALAHHVREPLELLVPDAREQRNALEAFNN